MAEIAIPYGAYWSTPFAKWQGSLAHLHSLKFGAHITKEALAARRIDPAMIDFGVLGMTVPQRNCFYGLPWLTGMAGMGHVAGPTINQACATGARILQVAADELARGDANVALAIAADRVSNGAHLYYPAPHGPGGTGEHEDWVLDNFEKDPYGGTSMLQTAENVARLHDFDTQRQNELTLLRYEQYQEALADDSAFLKRFMTLPFAVPDARFRRTQTEMTGDEGIFPTTAEGLAKLKPVMPEGTVTFGGQTHPADGCAGMVLTTPDKAREISSDPGIAIRVLAFGQARVEPAHMPMAPVPAAQRALAAANLKIEQVNAIKTHNPFVVNDLYFAETLGVDPAKMNRFGCSLIWGHPQGPTGVRAVIELVEELVLAGGGYGLYTGCAAGDSAMAVVIHVGDDR